MPTLTLQDLDNRVLSRLDGNTLLYTVQERYGAINESIRVLNLMVAFLQTTIPVPTFTIANRHFYDVPAGIVIPLRVQFENTYLGVYGINELGRAYPTWSSDTTATTAIPVTYWLPLGITKFAIWPADARGGGNLLVTGVQEPIPLVNPSDTVAWPNEVTSAFDSLAASFLPLKEGGETFAKASLYYQDFIRVMKRIMIWKGMTFPAFYVPEGLQKR